MAGILDSRLNISNGNQSSQNINSMLKKVLGSPATTLETLLGAVTEQRYTHWEVSTSHTLPHHVRMTGKVDVVALKSAEEALLANMSDFLLLEDEEITLEMPLATKESEMIKAQGASLQSIQHQSKKRRSKAIKSSARQCTSQEGSTYVLGQAKLQTVKSTVHSLSRLRLGLPTRTQALVQSVNLGQGEACFLRAQSALWAWRTHRQSHLDVHVNGPPAVHRSVLLQYNIGLITILQGCRVLEVNESERQWSYSLGSLEGQFFQIKEHFSLEWNDQNEVILEVHQALKLASKRSGLVLLAPLMQIVCRHFLRGYVQAICKLVD